MNGKREGWGHITDSRKSPVSDARLEVLRDAYAYLVASSRSASAPDFERTRRSKDIETLSVIEELQAFRRAALKQGEPM